MHVAYVGEWVVITGVVGSCAAIYVAAAFLLSRVLFSPKHAVPALGLTGKLILIAAGLGIAAIAYALYVEPYSLEVTHIRIPINGLPVSAGPIRIVQISDLHSDPVERLESKVSEAVKNEHPDLILFTGDACNSREGFSNFYKCILALRPIAPIFAVKGDWDFWPDFDPFGQAGLHSLNGCKVVTVRGAKLAIVGSDSGLNCSDSLRQAPENVPIILLNHSPDADVVLNYNATGIDLICCGHTHGGQIALPFYGALITQAKSQRLYARDLHKVGSAYIYTNRGIGMEGHFPRMRFFAKPEVTVFELVPTGRARQNQWHAYDLSVPSPAELEDFVRTHTEMTPINVQPLPFPAERKP